ncbi:MAG: ribonuclease H-like domain-containing protein [Candidatus Paceibacterota bacterium]
MVSRDKIVFDIETKDTFADVGGKSNFLNLSVSVVGTYSYNKDEYKVFGEDEMESLGELLKTANPLIGFSSKNFDVPVLNKYFDFNLTAVPHFDILEEIRSTYGRRIALNYLGKANLGLEKTSHGLEASNMYKRGEIEKLKEYCQQDVKITKEIFDLIEERGYLWIPQRNTPQMEKVHISYNEPDISQESLI